MRRLYSNIATDKDLGQCLRSEEYSGGKLSPVEFICVGLLIGVCGVGIGGGKARLGLEGLSREIERMREVVRAEHVDIRMNDRVAKTMLGFIRGVGAGSGSAGVKRKRAVAADGEREESVEEGELVNGKVAKTGAKAATSPVKWQAPTSPTTTTAGRQGSRIKETARKTTGAAAPRAPLGDKLASMRAAKLQTQQNAQNAPRSGAGISSSSTASTLTLTTTPTSAGASRSGSGMVPSPVSQQPLRLPKYQPTDPPTSIQSQRQPPPQMQNEAQTHGTHYGNRGRLEHPPGSNPALPAYQHHHSYSQSQSQSHGGGGGDGYGRRDSWRGDEVGGGGGGGGGRRSATSANAVRIGGGGMGLGQEGE